ncbi:MAG: hypothetical protein WCB67_14695 [Solirubrobacteraceae bacterium]
MTVPTLLAPESAATEQCRDDELLIREARRRQRRRQLAIIVVLVAVPAAYLVARAATSPRLSVSLLARPLHFPALGPRGRCPVSRGSKMSNSYFTGSALGRGQVRVLLADRGDVLRGRVDLGASPTPGWSALQTLWIAMPEYTGRFVVRAARLGVSGPIEVQPSTTGLSPGTGPLIVGGGPTSNSQDGYRTVPGSTWVKAPGCYAWQVDGSGFSETVVVDAMAPAT